MGEEASWTRAKTVSRRGGHTWSVPFISGRVWALRFCSALQEELCGGENTRCGFGSRGTLLKATRREREVVTTAETDTEDLHADVTSLIHSLCARRSGPRSAQRTTAKKGPGMGGSKCCWLSATGSPWIIRSICSSMPP